MVNTTAKSSRKRSPTTYTIAGVILAVVGFAAVVIVGGRASAQPAGPAVAVAQQDVVVANRDIAIRTSIAAGDAVVAKFASNEVFPGAYLRLDQVKGLVAAIDIKKGQPITSNLLLRSGDVVTVPQTAFLPIPTGFVALTIPTGEQQGVAGFIQAGDYITAIAIVAPKSGSLVNARTIFINLHVIKTGTAASDLQPGSAGGVAGPAKPAGVTSSLTVVMTQCQAEYMNWFLANEQLKYTLESYRDYQPQDTATDATCPNLGAAHGVTEADVRARWPGLL